MAEPSVRYMATAERIMLECRGCSDSRIAREFATALAEARREGSEAHEAEHYAYIDLIAAVKRYLLPNASEWQQQKRREDLEAHLRRAAPLATPPPDPALAADVRAAAQLARELVEFAFSDVETIDNEVLQEIMRKTGMIELAGASEEQAKRHDIKAELDALRAVAEAARDLCNAPAGDNWVTLAGALAQFDKARGDG